MKKELYYCDMCKKEVQDFEIVKESIPIINELYATGGAGNIKLAYLGESLNFEEKDLCAECKEKYEHIWTKGMMLIAQTWKQQIDLIK